TLVKDTFIKYNRGILVDENMGSSVNFINAAGDVAEGKDMITGNNSVIAIWPVAAKQGKVAGMNMAGSDIIYDGLFPMNAVDIVGVPVISFGITNPSETDGYEIVKERRENIYKKIVLKDNRIVGCIFLGRIERSGIFQGLIKYKIDVSRFKDELLSDDFGLLVLPAEYRKHMVRGEGIEV
ncbi:MAG TPA: NAD(P)/FAD-dependent oxidoreductase, partial [bacterium]|nr:NAD(P)/FAD-dependent oxidoreductase [bacterium]